MKKLLTIALSFSLFALSANAQVTRNVNPSQKIQRDSTHKRDGKMMKSLNLTQDQKVKLKESQQNMKQQRDAIKNDASLTQEQKKVKMQELHKSQKDKMNSILTPDQKAKMQAERREWNGKNGEGARGNGKMMKGLNLTDAQKAQMKANQASMKQQRDAIQNDASLTQDQKKTKMQELMKTQREKMGSILTPEQKAKMQADKKNWSRTKKDSSNTPKTNG